MTDIELSNSQKSDVLVSVENVSKHYGKFSALEKVSFEMHPGEHMLVLGPNGAGKTTLIKCMMDVINFEGRVTIGGVDVKHNPSKAKANLGYVPQNYAFYEGISVLDHAILSTRLKGVSKSEAEDKLKQVNLWDARKKKVRALSDGMKQRLGIALALIADPKILLLDEPTSNVDLRGQLEFMGLLQELIKSGKTLVTTTHLTGLGEIATEVMILNRGKIVTKGSPSELLTNLGVNDTIYARVDPSDAPHVIELAKKMGALDISSRDEWMTISVPTKSKLEIVRSLLTDGGKVKDLFVERSKIESEYFKLLGGEKN